MRVVFLDIDGVLLTSRALALPGNAGRYAEALRCPPISSRDLSLAARFDHCAVALVDRLCNVTGAALVICSNWRTTVGAEATRCKLIEEGIDPARFHRDCVTPSSSGRGHAAEVTAWLDEHRLMPFDPKRPDRSERSGIDWVAIDDAFHERGEHPRCVRTDPDEGLTAAGYRIAVGLLRGVDPLLGVHPVEDADHDRVLGAFELAAGERWAPMHAARFLHRPVRGGSRARMLRPFRSDGEASSYARQRWEGVWQDLAAEVDRLVCGPGSEGGDEVGATS